MFELLWTYCFAISMTVWVARPLHNGEVFLVQCLDRTTLAKSTNHLLVAILPREHRLHHVTLSYAGEPQTLAETIRFLSARSGSRCSSSAAALLNMHAMHVRRKVSDCWSKQAYRGLA